MTNEELDRIGRDIVDVAFQIHSKYGPGLLESVYENLHAHGLRQRGHHVEQQKRIVMELEGIYFGEVFRPDLVVDDGVVVEIKAHEKIHPVHERQTRTYMKLLDFRLGYLINFGEMTIKSGIRRFVYKY